MRSRQPAANSYCHLYLSFRIGSDRIGSDRVGEAERELPPWFGWIRLSVGDTNQTIPSPRE